jgi:integrase
MMIITPKSPNAVFIPASVEKNTASALRRFVRWLDVTGRAWWQVDLVDYRAHLLHETALSDASAKKHLERVRKRYGQLLRSNTIRDAIQAALPAGTTLADRYAATEEVLVRIANNTQYSDDVAITLPTDVARVDSDFTWLSVDDVEAVLDAIERDRLGYRDAAMIALAFMFGLREAELCAVTLEALRETKQGKPGVLIERGKGMKRRFVFLHDAVDFTPVVQDWIGFTALETGPLFDITPRAFAYRLRRYTSASPHDLRRSYARALYDANAPIEFVRQQLGHVKVETTLLYVGALTG